MKKKYLEVSCEAIYILTESSLMAASDVNLAKDKTYSSMEEDDFWGDDE